MLEGKNILIIGGTSGIGLSAVKAFVKSGAKVIAVGLENANLPILDNCHFLFADVRTEENVENAVEKCIKSFGSLDGLYHVAGGSGRKWGDGPLHEMSIEAWSKTINLNLNSVMISNRAAIKAFMKDNKGGSILNLSTLLAFDPSPKYFYTHAYAAAKAAIMGFSKSLASYYAQYDIRVNVLSPGLTDTPMAQRAAQRADIQSFIKTKQPLDGGRMVKTTDLDAAAIYFLSDASKFTTGQVLGVDGGWSVSEGQYDT